MRSSSLQHKGLSRFALLYAIALFLTVNIVTAVASGLPVRDAHPRIMLDSTVRARLLAKKSANDSDWQVLKQRADQLKNFTVIPYSYATRNDWYSNAIMYSFQGSNWYESTMILGLAWQMTGDTAYCNKLLQLADEMIRAEYDPNTAQYRGPFQVNNTYASRYLGTAVGVIYDWCYDRLGSTRKAQLIALMNRWFDHLRLTPDYNTYEKLGPATGNFFGGHMAAAAYMGYATAGDNSRAQHMIDWARIRFDGTTSATLTPGTANGDIPTDNRAMAFEGNFLTRVGRMYMPPELATGAPFKGGFNFQGWAYGNNEFCRMIDYMITVKTATGEDLIDEHRHWFKDMFASLRHALFPNRITIDPVADWGGNQGAVIQRGLPVRLAHVLNGTADSAAAQHFAWSEIPQNTSYGYYAKDITIYPLVQWEGFYFRDNSRTMAQGTMPLYNSAFGPAYPQAGATNGALPRFIQRNNWSTTATWVAAEMGAAFYGDHMMYHAGHIYMTHGGNQLLISPSNWRGTAPGLGVIGSGVSYVVHSSLKNTLFLDDFGTYQRDRVDQHGGQSTYGFDRVVAAQQNDAHTYVRSDLTSAYYNVTWPLNWVDTNNRSLRHFYRSFLYLRNPNLVVTFDQVKVKNSTHANGQFNKHLRWHFPVQPQINGKSVTVVHANSKMHLHTLLPATQKTTAVSLQNNPDNKWGSSFNYAFNSSTWRIEVKDTTNALELPFLTVMQPGSSSMAEMQTSTLYTADETMTGARIATADAVHYVLFNNRPGQVPTPISSTSYAITTGEASHHTLCGLEPATHYAASVSNGTVTIAADNNGAFTTTDAGVLEFAVNADGSFAKTATAHSEAGTAFDLSGYPNPATAQIAFSFSLSHSSASSVHMAVYNAAGAKVADVLNSALASGSYTIPFATSTLPAGSYYCELVVDGRRTVMQFVVQR